MNRVFCKNGKWYFEYVKSRGGVYVSDAHSDCKTAYKYLKMQITQTWGDR